VARFVVFALMPDATAALVAVQVLHGICYAFFFATVYIFIDVAFPKDVRSSAQGLFNLLILGEGPDRSALEAQARTLGIADRVFLPGFVANPYPYFKHARMFVLSSRYEGLAMVLLEALALAAPVLAMDCPSGPRELLENGRFGVLVPPGSATALATAIRELASSPEQEARLRSVGPIRAARHDASRVSARFEQVLVAAHSARPPAPRQRAS